MDIQLEIVLEWDVFPENFVEKWMREIARSERCDGGVIIDVHAEYTPGCPGRYDGHPDNMYPAEEPEIEICGIVITVRRDMSVSEEPFPEQFLDICHQFASDWLDIEDDWLEKRLLEFGATTHQNEIAEILFGLEMAADAERLRRREEEALADFEAATWAAGRTNAPDEG